MDYNKIGQFIASERKNLKLTQAKLAEKLFVSEKTISKWENGNGVPDTNTLPKLCEIFRISDCINLVFRNNFQQLCIQHQASLRKGGGFAEGKNGGSPTELYSKSRDYRVTFFYKKSAGASPRPTCTLFLISADRNALVVLALDNGTYLNVIAVIIIHANKNSIPDLFAENCLAKR